MPNPLAAMILATRKPPEGEEPPADDKEDMGDDDLEVAMEDFLHAVASKDAAGMADAFRHAFMMCESKPHEEGPHEDEEGMPPPET